MYPTILRQGLFPVLDALNGTKVGPLLRFLEGSQWQLPEDLMQLQLEKLRAMLQWTQRHSSFYSTLWRQGGTNRCARSEYPELDGLPVVTKEELRAHRNEFPPSAYHGRIYAVP